MINQTTAKYSIKRSLNCSQQKNQIIIGTNLADSYEMEVSEDWVFDLINHLDGTKTIMELAASLKSCGNQVKKDDIITVLEMLNEANLLEESEERNAAIKKSTLTDLEMERYDRQLLLFESVTNSIQEAIKVQESIKQAKITLVGIGGVGSYVYYSLAAMGIGTLTAVDFDEVELSNLSRQVLYTEKDIGQLKIDAAKRKAKSINSNSQYHFINKMIKSEQDAAHIMKGQDLVILSADIPRGKLLPLVNAAAYQSNTTILYGGSAKTHIACGPLVIPGETPCFECITNHEKKNHHPAVDRIATQYTTSLIDPYNAIAGSMMALEAVKYLTKFQPCQTQGKIKLIDTDQYAITTIEGKRRNNCRYCSTEEALAKKVHQLFEN